MSGDILCRFGLHRWKRIPAHSDYPYLGIRLNYFIRSCRGCGVVVDPLSEQLGMAASASTLVDQTRRLDAKMDKLVGRIKGDGR